MVALPKDPQFNQANNVRILPKAKSKFDDIFLIEINNFISELLSEDDPRIANRIANIARSNGLDRRIHFTEVFDFLEDIVIEIISKNDLNRLPTKDEVLSVLTKES